jgi:deazaflavin-dependent oxidoreductase (nitroreductase family)
MAADRPPRGTTGRPVPRLSGPLLRGLHALVFRLFRRRRFLGVRLLRLHTVGARSGQPRATTLGYLPDGDDAWLITASAGGAASHPAWYHNLARHPDEGWVEVGDRTVRVRPEALRGAAREAAYRRFAAAAPGYAGYPRKAARTIPVVRLTALP